MIFLFRYRYRSGDLYLADPRWRRVLDESRDAHLSNEGGQYLFNPTRRQLETSVHIWLDVQLTGPYWSEPVDLMEPNNKATEYSAWCRHT